MNTKVKDEGRCRKGPPKRQSRHCTRVSEENRLETARNHTHVPLPTRVQSEITVRYLVKEDIKPLDERESDRDDRRRERTRRRERREFLF